MTHVPGTMGPTPPLVGRAAERVLLTEQLSAMETGNGKVVIIGGEAGIGKTTVARDLVDHARERGFLAIVGHCHDLMAAPPYGLWLDLAADYRHAAMAAELPPLPDVLADQNLDRVTSQSAFFADVTAFLQAIATNQPAVVVLEDVHWADPASLELLRHVSVRVSHLPLLIMVTYRVDELTRRNPFYHQLPALVRESGGLRLDLKRLSRSDLGAFVMAQYGLADEDRDRLVDYLEEHAEGNPFYVMELLRALEELDSGGLTISADEWSLSQLDRLVMPPLVRQVIDARVDRLGESIRQPMTVAAVIGQELSLDLLLTVSGMDDEELYQVIDTAIEWHLLVPTSDGSGIQFVHALTRQALYESLAPHRRNALHRSVAEELEHRSPPDPDAIAFHYQRAGDPRAPEWLMRAGDRAQRAYAWLTARDRFLAAATMLDGVPGEEGTRARLLYRCGRLQRYSNADAAIEHLRTAARLADMAGDTVLAADATYSQGLVQCFADQWQTGLADMTRGVELLESLPPDDAYISVATANWMADALPTIPQNGSDPPPETTTAIGPNRHRSMPWFLAAAGRLIEARDLTESYRQLPEESNPGPLALANTGHAEFGFGMALTALGHPNEAHAAMDNARRAYLQLDHHAVLAFVDITEMVDVVVPYRTEDVDARRRLANDAAIAIDRARSAIPSEVTPDRAKLVNLFLDGHWDEARRIATACRVHGTYVLRRPVTHTLVQIACHQGDTDTAWEHIVAMLPQGPNAEPGSAVLLDALMLQRIAAALCIDAGGFDLARRWLASNERWLEWSGSVLGRGDSALAWSRLHQATGNLEDAASQARTALELASNPRQPLLLIEARRLLGELAFTTGNALAAKHELETSLELADACALPFQRAQVLVELARLPDADSATLLTEAQGIFERLGAQPALERIRALHSEGTTGSVREELPGGLTTREIEVLKLVAQGMTDAEVGEALSISPRTVGQHLRSIYNKLDARSRLEATRFAIEQRLI